MTYHKDDDQLMTSPQSADLLDFVEPDTAYAVVLQAVNQDGPGPYSEQHTIRTMSRGSQKFDIEFKFLIRFFLCCKFLFELKLSY